MASSFTIRRADPSSIPVQQHQHDVNYNSKSHQTTAKPSATFGAPDVQELSRTSKYKISKLSKYNAPQSLLPTSSVFNGDQFEYSTADINTDVKYATHSTATTISVWKYAPEESSNASSVSESQNQLSIQLPVKNNAGSPPLVNLIPNISLHSPNQQDIGILITNTHGGLLTYYSSINHVQSSGLLKSHSPLTYEVRLYDGEHITISERIGKLSGILVLCTSFGRLLLVSLNYNDEGIKVREMEGKKTGFFSKYLHPSHEFVSVKSIDSAAVSYNEALICTVTRGGKFSTYSLSNDGQFIKREELAEFGEVLASHVEGLYVDVRKTLQVLDITALPDSDNLLLLAAFQDTSSVNADDWCYVLFTLKRNYQELMIDGAYRMNTYNLSPVALPNSVRLYVPAPGFTAFVVFDSNVVLVELQDPSAASSTVSMRNTKKKWEDIISFQDSLTILASDVDCTGSESEPDKNPTVTLVLDGVGIVQVERLPQQADNQKSSSAGVIKSHIEQAVFFSSAVTDSSSNPIEFSFPSTFSTDKATMEEIQSELLVVASEILSSRSAYLPPTLNDLSQHLQLRKEKMEKLLKYASHNFREILSEDVRFGLIALYEKICSACEIYQVLAQADQETSKFYQDAVTELGYDADGLFLNGLEYLPRFLLIFVSKLSSYSSLAVKVIISAYSPILSVSTQLRSEYFELDETHVPKTKPWYLADGLYEVIDESYQSYYNSMKQMTANQEFKQNIIELTNVLFYLLQQRIIWSHHQIESSSEYNLGKLEESLVKDESYYASKSTIWVQSLYSLGYHEEAIAIAENYKDMKSLVLILDDAQGESSDGRLDHYFLEFGYTFAEALYSHYISTNQLSKLFQIISVTPSSSTLGGSYLDRFMAENHDQYNHIAWIKELMQGEEIEAAKSLIESATASEGDETGMVVFGSEKREVLLSIAKLAAFAQLEEGEVNTNNSEPLSLLSSIQENLDVVEVQSLLMAQLQPYLTTADLSTVDADSLTSDMLAACYQDQSKFYTLKRAFTRSLGRLLHGDSLSLNEIIELLTMFKIDSVAESTQLNHLHALRLIHLSSSVEFSQRQFSEKLTWLRSLTLHIQSISTQAEELQNKSDEYKKQYIQETPLYQTIRGYFDLELYKEDSTGYSMSLPSFKTVLGICDNEADLSHHFPYLNTDELRTIQGELTQQVDSITASADVESLEKSVMGMIGEIVADFNGGIVVNYEDLSVGY
ncbi:hypothetical protein WICPIJ_006831 [Wickerhamomyces pijperi]|uniref:Nucleoporin Nup133/Nup155-like C-terminal domain-containing protein n=1 Tax=Wickerhamomyces pijperi TaxID=599730 RepID=A0A9P8Q2T7_WICPI|nr:hypothetical protein WICPIJ_006831 [Wickerhamomyces pijperi]